MNPVTSEADVEQIALDLFQEMQWSSENVYYEELGERRAQAARRVSAGPRRELLFDALSPAGAFYWLAGR